MSDSVLYEVLEEVAYITLNRPDKLNAMDDDLLAGVAQALAQASSDTQAKVVVMRGAGRVVLDKDVSRAAQVGMLDLERHLMRGQVDLAAPLDHLEFHHNEQTMRERQQTIWDA